MSNIIMREQVVKEVAAQSEISVLPQLHDRLHTASDGYDWFGEAAQELVRQNIEQCYHLLVIEDDGVTRQKIAHDLFVFARLQLALEMGCH